MALFSCSKCNNHNFEIKLVEPNGSRYKQYFVQCSSCGVPVGVVDFYNTGNQLEEMKNQISDLTQSIKNTEYIVQQMAQVMNNRR